MEFYTDYCVVKDKTTWVPLLWGTIENDLYLLKSSKYGNSAKSTPLSLTVTSCKPQSIGVSPKSTQIQTYFGRECHLSNSIDQDSNLHSCFTVDSSNKWQLWHKRLGHASENVVYNVLNKCKISGWKRIATDFFSACQYARSHVLPSSLSQTKSTRALQLIHIDVWGPSPIVCMGTIANSLKSET